MTLRGLYAITDTPLLAGGRLLPYAEAALRGGARLLQYRDKSGDDARRFDEAQALAELCQRHGATLIINDDLELAARLGGGLLRDAPVAVARAGAAAAALAGAAPCGRRGRRSPAAGELLGAVDAGLEAQELADRRQAP